MKLSINNIEWLDWLNYEPRFDADVPCIDINLAKSFVCYTDVGAQTVTGALHADWVYKLINYNVDKVFFDIRDGFVSEYHKFLEMLQCFPCG